MLQVFSGDVAPTRTMKPKESTAKWLVNGFPATVQVWTADEWKKLRVKPIDAQQCANGTWVTFRID